MKPVVAKDKIMNTAKRLFFEQGYNLTGINQITEEADISKPSLYNHFKSKSDLLVAYLEQQYKDWFVGYNNFTENITGPLEKLIAMVDYRIDRQLKSDFGGCAWHKITAETPKHDVWVFERTTKFKAAIKAIIADLVKQLNRPEGKLLNDDDLTESIFLQIEGAIIITYITKSHQPLDNVKAIIRQLV